MTANVLLLPNSLHCTGDRTYSQRFAGLSRVTPVNLPGRGHHPHLRVQFVGDLRIDLDPITAAALILGLPEGLAKLGLLPDCSAILARMDGNDR